jgi:hypothetical protein
MHYGIELGEKKNPLACFARLTSRSAFAANICMLHLPIALKADADQPVIVVMLPW